MRQTQIIRKLRAYLTGLVTLQQLRDWAEDYEWCMQDDKDIQSLMGFVELYITEIDEGLRTEDEFKRMLKDYLYHSVMFSKV